MEIKSTTTIISDPEKGSIMFSGIFAQILECDVPKLEYKNVHWYQWGDEPSGCVSVGRYSPNGEWIPMGIRPKEYAIEALGATHHCPYA